MGCKSKEYSWEAHHKLLHPVVVAIKYDSAAGVVILHLIDGRMDHEMYITVFQKSPA